MKPRVTLVVASLLSILFTTLHHTDDILRGMAPGNAINVLVVLFVVGWLYGTLVLADRRSGQVIVLVASPLADSLNELLAEWLKAPVSDREAIFGKEGPITMRWSANATERSPLRIGAVNSGGFPQAMVLLRTRPAPSALSDRILAVVTVRDAFGLTNELRVDVPTVYLSGAPEELVDLLTRVYGREAEELQPSRVRAAIQPALHDRRITLGELESIRKQLLR